MTFDEAKNCLRFCDSYSRLPNFLDLEPTMERSDSLRLLGELWTISDNISAHLERLQPLMLESKTIPEMMTRWERVALSKLPDIFRVYRGCYLSNMCGVSWSLSEKVAEKFPFYLRYRQEGTPIMVVAEVEKNSVIALKLDRKEREIITLRPKIIGAYTINEKLK